MRRRVPLAAAGFAAFAVLATGNSAGYRFGASDQAFYLPAAVRAVDPTFFPRDAPLLDAQARLTAADEVLGAAIKFSGAASLDFPIVLFAAYLATLALLCAAAYMVGRTLSRSVWAGVALAAALTLRHGISRAGVNTLEGYFHPRLVVFAAGILALAWFVQGRTRRALLLVLLATALHPTTGAWFLVWLGVATIVVDRRARVPAAILGAAAALAALWALLAGPLGGRLVVMDAAWLSAIEGKDYLFPDRWPAHAWIANLAGPAIVAAVAYARSRAGRLAPAERGLVAGAFALLAVFLVSLPFTYLRVALAIQLQIARVFWMLDFLATAFAVGWLVDRAGRRAALVAAAIALAAVARGAYIMTVEFPARPLVRLSLPPDDWRDAMGWAAAAPRGAHWLAHPGHAYLYGTSVRVAARRDVFHEAVKDAAVAMYARPIAERVLERGAAVADFDALDAERARRLAARYQLDFLITETRGLALPVAYSNGRFVVYRLR